MVTATVEDKARRVCSIVDGQRRLGVSDFARSKEWRTKLLDEGCLEVVDHSETIGYVMAPEYASALTSYIRELEEELENAHIRMLFDLREEYAEFLSGEELAQKALENLEANQAQVKEFLDACR